MPRMIGSGLSRREREILDVLHRLEKASLDEVTAAVPDAPSSSAIRALLHIMERKGLVRHHKEGRRHLYEPAEPRDNALRAALDQLITTFFGGNKLSATKALVPELTPEQRSELLDMIRRSPAPEEKGKTEP